MSVVPPPYPPPSIGTEPVAVTTAISVLIAAVLTVLSVFGVWTPTTDQYEALMALYGALILVLGAVTRSQVTPNARVEKPR